MASLMVEIESVHGSNPRSMPGLTKLRTALADRTELAYRTRFFDRSSRAHAASRILLRPAPIPVPDIFRAARLAMTADTTPPRGLDTAAICARAGPRFDRVQAAP